MKNLIEKIKDVHSEISKCKTKCSATAYLNGESYTSATVVSLIEDLSNDFDLSEDEVIVLSKAKSLLMEKSHKQDKEIASNKERVCILNKELDFLIDKLEKDFKSSPELEKTYNSILLKHLDSTTEKRLVENLDGLGIKYIKTFKRICFLTSDFESMISKKSESCESVCQLLKKYSQKSKFDYSKSELMDLL